MEIRSFADLETYREAVSLQRAVFELSKGWPMSESYALTDQVRRSSRAIGAAIAEAWAKRRYEAHFISKLTDADAELQETKHWVTTAVDCGYLPAASAAQLAARCDTIASKLGGLMTNRHKFCR